MGLKILCSIYLVRHPVGGHAWHHFQYLAGLQRLGHEVVCAEHFGWERSCYNPHADQMSGDPQVGLGLLQSLLEPMRPRVRHCFLAEDGRAHGMSREELAQFCRECDLHLSLSNMNCYDEMSLCRRNALVDTDPVFTQIGAHGMVDPAQFDLRFTYGENVHRSGCSMPTGNLNWLPTRQPVVLDLWPLENADPSAPLTSVMNWSAYGDHHYNGQSYGQKDREFEPYFDLPRRVQARMELAVSAPASIVEHLRAGGWNTADPLRIAADPWGYQQYLRRSRGEWCVAKHGYVATQCGWFSDRSAGYLASGRPVILQDTGFSRFLPCGKGLLCFTNPATAIAAIQSIEEDFAGHCRAARALAGEYFDSARVLGDLLEKCL